jgi:3-deoxy-D-manno-octulosonic-acid transferase
MMRSLYGLTTWALQPFVRRKLNRRAVVEPLYGEHMAERFGCYTHFDKLSASGVGEHANRNACCGHSCDSAAAGDS